MTNATTGNGVQSYLRAPDGSLVAIANTLTGGTGVGHGLENQGALALSGDGRFLYVVNPGSNDLTVFRVTDTTLQLTDRVPSGGTLPVSVAELNGIVYVLNRHASDSGGGAESGPTIRGFQVATSGTLSPIAGSDVQLQSADTNAAQIAISPDGLWIVVTERGVNQIDVVPLSANHLPGTPRSAPSSGRGPFGFAFSDEARLYVSEAASGTTSAYDIDAGGMSRLLNTVPTEQRAACWLVIAPDNDLLYVSNTSSSSLSSYRIAQDGTLTRLISVAATTVGGPLDAIISADGSYLSVLTTVGSIETFRIDATSGSLVSIQTISGLPAGTNGLAAR